MNNKSTSANSSLKWSVQDIEMMNRAIMLAKKGCYTTRPNPNVGCVITNHLGNIVGEGWHQRAGEAHAEVYALAMAGAQAKNGTAYVTLEPCSHYGRTPPCAEALIKSGVNRVVVAMTDPNPQVAGNGIELLTQAGIKVELGLLALAARELNAGFLSRMERQRPYVTVKLAASIDGKTALENGESKWITNSASRSDVQRLRAKHDAIITGIETVLADDPALTVRHHQLGSLAETLSGTALIQPTRIILDSRCRMPLTAQLLNLSGNVILVSTQSYSAEFIAALPENVTTLVLKSINSRVDLTALLKHLGQNYNNVLVEAGATLCGAFIEAELVDELILYQAPKLLGSKGRNLVSLPNYQQIAETPALTLIEQRQFGSDTRFVFKLGN